LDHEHLQQDNAQCARSVPKCPPAPLPETESAGRRAIQSVFKVKQFNDIHERAADLKLKLPAGGKRAQRIERIRKAGVLFVHVPKNAGTSICNQLYGGIMMHESARYYRHVAPELFRSVPSFAIWRHPVERFVSAYAFARHGGTSRVSIHPSVRDTYSAFSCLDDAITHVENTRSPYDLDHVFRPQSWYVCDRNNNLIVNQLFSMDMLPHLQQHVPALQNHPISHLNENKNSVQATEKQAARILNIYAQDKKLAQHLFQI